LRGKGGRGGEVAEGRANLLLFPKKEGRGKGRRRG